MSNDSRFEIPATLRNLGIIGGIIAMILGLIIGWQQSSSPPHMRGTGPAPPAGPPKPAGVGILDIIAAIRGDKKEK